VLENLKNTNSLNLTQLDKYNKDKNLNDFADEIRKRIFKFNIDFFINQFKYEEYRDFYYEIELNDMMFELTKVDRNKIISYEIIPVSYSKFIFGYRVHETYHYFVINRLKQKILCDKTFCTTGVLAIYLKNEFLAAITYMTINNMKIELFNMSFELKSTTSINLGSNCYYSLDEIFHLNEKYVIIFFRQKEPPYVEYYDLAFKKLRQEPIDDSIFCRFMHASNDYLVLVGSKYLHLINIHTNKRACLTSGDFVPFTTATLLKDSPYLIATTKKHASIFSCDDKTLLFRCVVEDYFPHLYEPSYEPTYKLSIYQDCLFAYNNPIARADFNNFKFKLFFMQLKF
jgi:hypothetical protein